MQNIQASDQAQYNSTHNTSIGDGINVPKASQIAFDVGSNAANNPSTKTDSSIGLIGDQQQAQSPLPPGSPQIQHKDSDAMTTDLPINMMDRGNRSQPQGSYSSIPSSNISGGSSANQQLVSPKPEAEPKKLSNGSDLTNYDIISNDRLDGSIRDTNGQTLPAEEGKKITRFSFADRVKYERLLSYIINAYGNTYAAQMQQSLWAADREYDSGKISFADRVVNRLFQKMAGSENNITQEEVNRRVSEVMGDRKAILNPYLASVFVPKELDEKQTLERLFASRRQYFDNSRGTDRIFPWDADDR